MGSQVDDLNANGDVTCENLEVRGNIKLGGSIIPPPASSSLPLLTFVFRPLGFAGDNVFTDFALCAAAINSVEGKRALEWDLGGAGFPTPIGVFPMVDVVWVSAPGAAQLIDLSDGSFFPGLSHFSGNLQVRQQSTTTSPIELAAFPGTNQIIVEGGATLVNVLVGVVPMFTATALALVSLTLRQNGEVLGTGVDPVFSLPFGGNITVTIEDQFSTFGNAVASNPGVGDLVLYAVDGPAFTTASANQPAWAGSIAIIGTMGRATPDPIQVGDFLCQLDRLSRVDGTVGPILATLPLAFDLPGVQIIVKNVTAGVGPITLTPQGADTVDGAPGFVMATARQAIRVASDGGSDWMIIGSFP